MKQSNLIQLTEGDPHHRGPIIQVEEWLKRHIGPEERVLEIGPGKNFFDRANVFVDMDKRADLPGELIYCDVCSERLPFKDKEFDLVYCRHTLEDLWNPFFAMDEMARVAKRGYIEVPSALSEYVRGVDGLYPPFRGYHHHRWIIWVEDGALQFVSKLALIEYSEDKGEQKLKDYLTSNPIYWNTHFTWAGSFQYRHHVGFKSSQYFSLIERAVNHSIASTEAFWQTTGRS